MYLSRIKLNTTLSRTMQALAAPTIFHGAIEDCEKCGKEERTRKLWRIDTLRNEKYLLILSEDNIDFSNAAVQFGYDSCFESKCYDNFLNKIENDSRWNFRLRANPTIQKSVNGNGRGKIMAHITTEFQEEWLKRKSEKCGFVLSDGEWLVTESQWYSFNKNKNTKSNVRLLAVTYEGILTVSDADLFRYTLTKGIGREKAYGMGMLTVAGIQI